MKSHSPPVGTLLRRSAAAAAALLLVGGTTAAPAAADEEGTDTLTVAMSQQVDSFNPFTAQLAVTTNILRSVYDTLVTVDPESGDEPAPALAEDWETSDDGLTWTFNLREDVHFSDGEQLTADDVAWTLTTIMENESAAVANGNYVSAFEEVTAEDDHTVVIDLEQPQATMTALNVPIVPQHVWEPILEEEGDDFSDYANEDFPTVGSGPFVLTEHERGQSIRLEANPDHWRGAPGFDELVFDYYTEQDAAVEALRSGEVSFVYDLTEAQATSLEGVDDVEVNIADGKRFQAFTVNPGAETRDGEEFGDGHPALSDKTLRQAIAMAIDNDEIVESGHNGQAVAAGGYIPPRYENFHWSPEGDEATLDFDPDAANDMLDEADYEMGDDGVRTSPDGDRLELRMHVHSDQPANVQAGQIMDERLAEIGIEVDNQTVDPGILSDALYDAEYDLIFTGWTVNPDPDYVFSIHTCDGLPTDPGTMQGDAYFCDEEYDELYEAQLEEHEDLDQRAEYIHDMQQILYEEAVVNVLSYPNIMEAYRTDQIADIQYEPADGGNIWGQDGYWAWWSAEPADAEDSAGAGVSTGALIGVGAVVLLALAGGGFYLIRRRSTVEDRE